MTSATKLRRWLGSLVPGGQVLAFELASHDVEEISEPVEVAERGIVWQHLCPRHCNDVTLRSAADRSSEVDRRSSTVAARYDELSRQWVTRDARIDPVSNAVNHEIVNTTDTILETVPVVVVGRQLRSDHEEFSLQFEDEIVRLVGELASRQT